MNSQGWPKDCTNELEMLVKAYKFGVCALCVQTQIFPVNMQGFGSMINILRNVKLICAPLLHIINDADSLIILFFSAHQFLHTPNQEK